MADLICIKTFAHWEEAEVARKLLESSGIDAMVRTEEGGSMTPAVAARTLLLVRQEDEEDAQQALQGVR